MRGNEKTRAVQWQIPFNYAYRRCLDTVSVADYTSLDRIWRYLLCLTVQVDIHALRHSKYLDHGT